MKFHIRMPGLNRYPPNFSPWEAELTSSDMQMIARKLEGLGFDALSVAEHIAMPRELARRMSAHWPDAMTAMSFLAGATENIRILSSIIVLPYHNPVVLKEAYELVRMIQSESPPLQESWTDSQSIDRPLGKRQRCTD